MEWLAVAASCASARGVVTAMGLTGLLESRAAELRGNDLSVILLFIQGAPRSIRRVRTRSLGPKPVVIPNRSPPPSEGVQIARQVFGPIRPNR
jgi:hypothetical protein